MLLSKGLLLSRLLLTACIAGLLFRATRSYRQKTNVAFDIEDTTPVGDGSPEEEYLERLVDIYGLTNYTKWQAWRILSSEQSLDVEPITDIHADFQPHSDTPKVIDVNNPRASDLRTSRRMELPIHSSPAQNKMHGSGFLFGVSTSYGRIADRDWAILRAWKRWLTNGNGSSNGAGLVLMLDNASSEQLDEIAEVLRDAGIDAHVKSTAKPTSKVRRYYDMIRVLKTYGAALAASGQAKQWFGVVDDTIFFPSLTYLRERLSTYNANDQLYIGIPSERSDWQQDGESVTTYGGGAIILSQRVVSLMPKLPCLKLDNPGPSFGAKKWDVVLKKCVKKEAGIDMHVMPAFYSPHDVDYRPHLESHETGMRPLLLHDYQNRHRIDVGMAHLVTEICGEACFMHQYLFLDNWAVINGMSISHHPDGLSHHHHHNPLFLLLHHGRQDKDERDDFKMAAKTPVSGQLVINEDKVDRKPLKWTGRREVWKLVDSARVTNGSVWQAYLKRGVRTATRPEIRDGQSKPSEEEMDSVIVLIWGKKKREHQ
ncbi:hypothetical protein C2857_007295 [Epichloe festucae Fl1]|uniref:Fringe-like glycosyltransferase domain-containing protein n=1 Tax=Epichloe festucae (strain Fl1) TaxID=877507 RepID=A0A7S9KMB0_EPIFF|nr:hypothetical protein C2857_007295 [Epichloe festucae Fl1]